MSPYADPGVAPVAIVTGASRGIGAATASRLIDDGYHVVLAARSLDRLESVARSSDPSGLVSEVVETDVAVISDLDRLVERAYDRFGRVDVLVNNAGVLPSAARSERLEVGSWKATLDVNLTGPWYLACRCKEVMATGGRGGVVVNVTSTASFYPSVGLSSYNASKAALNMVTRGLALEWARDGIRVIGIAPGKVDTELAVPVVAHAAQRGRALNPMGRLAAPHEVAGLIVFMVSPMASYMTGTIVTLDGGEVTASGADLSR